MPSCDPAPPTPAAAARPGPRLRDRLRAACALDLRSLALFRVALALCILTDLALRAPFLSQHYSDDGFLPRHVLIEHVPEYVSPLALHLVSGSAAYQGALFALAALAAFALGLGHRTRLATFLCWWLQLSLHMRDPFSLNGGNHQLRLALFWALFLPLGARASLDARGQPPPGSDRVSGIAPFALLVQVFLIYFCAGLAKDAPQWLQMGNALHWVMIDPDWTHPLARVAAGHPEVLRVFTFATVALELAAPFAFFVPAWNGALRSLAVVSLVLLQLGIGLTMRLGVFPLVSIAVLLGLLPGGFWERFGGRREARGPLAAGARPAAGGWARARELCAALSLVWVVAHNLDFWLEGLRLPAWFARPGHALKLDQYWNMYHSVHRAQFRWDMLGTTASGEQVDLSHPGYGPRWAERVQSLARDPFWRETASNLQGGAGVFLRPELAAFWCRQWNADAPPAQRLVRVELFYVARYLRLSGEHAPWSARSEGEFRCSER